MGGGCCSRQSGRTEVFGEHLGGCPPPEGLAGSTVQRRRDACWLLGTVTGEVGAFGEVLAQQPVGVLVGAALSRASRITEIDLKAAVDPELDVFGRLDPWSKVKDRRSCSGRVPIVSAIACRTAPAPAPVIGGPAFTVPTPRPHRRPDRMAVSDGHPQPDQAPPLSPDRRDRLRRGHRPPIWPRQRPRSPPTRGH